MVRKDGGLVLVQRVDADGNVKGTPFQVDRMRLRALTDRSKPIDGALIDALPWDGKGEDPLKPADRSGPAATRAFFA